MTEQITVVDQINTATVFSGKFPALSKLEQNLVSSLGSDKNPEVKSFPWPALIAALLPILLEQLGSCLDGGISLDKLAKDLTEGSFSQRLAASRMLRKALNESGETMSFVRRAAFMAKALESFKNEQDNANVLAEVQSLNWAFV